MRPCILSTLRGGARLRAAALPRIPPSVSSDATLDAELLRGVLSAEASLPTLDSVANEEREVLGVPVAELPPDCADVLLPHLGRGIWELLLMSLCESSASAARTTEQPEWLALREFSRGDAEKAERDERGVRSRSAVAVELVEGSLLLEQPEDAHRLLSTPPPLSCVRATGAEVGRKRLAHAGTGCVLCGLARRACGLPPRAPTAPVSAAAERMRHPVPLRVARARRAALGRKLGRNMSEEEESRCSYSSVRRNFTSTKRRSSRDTSG